MAITFDVGIIFGIVISIMDISNKQKTYF